jgi:HSP20 family protein
MTIVRRASPLGELVSLRQAMNRLFEESFLGARSWSFSGVDGYRFPIDVTNGPDSLVIEASLPGFKPEDVETTTETARAGA